MASVIIGIHGLGNKPKKATLEKWWYSAMLEGLKKHQKTTNLEAFELVYWADLLYDRPLVPSVVDRNDPYFLDERYEAASPRQHQEESPLRQKVLDFIEDQLDKLFLNDDLSVNYSGISDYIIHAYFRDLEAYYSAVASDGARQDVFCAIRHQGATGSGYQGSSRKEHHDHRPLHGLDYCV
jgi:hypothetical protein